MTAHNAEKAQVVNETTQALIASIGDRIEAVGDHQLLHDYRSLVAAATREPETTKPARKGWAVALAENTRQAAPRTEPLASNLPHDVEMGAVGMGWEKVHRDLTRRLGFGDGVTEPMADNDTIVAWFEERSRESAEWREHERFRDECALAGHDPLNDCDEHGPTCCHRAHTSPGVRSTPEEADRG